MSQSDYIKFIRTAEVLKNKELPPVFDAGDYTDYESYNLETTVSNTKNTYSRLVQPSNKTIFTIEKNVSNCTTFPLCVNTNLRTNRVLNTEQKIVLNGGVTQPYKPTPTYKPSKIYIPKTCEITLQNGTKRKVLCNKKICKCRTRIY